MPGEQARAIIEQELGGVPLDSVFEWIDLETPLGSASISQVQQHVCLGAAQLRCTVCGCGCCVMAEAWDQTRRRIRHPPSRRSHC